MASGGLNLSTSPRLSPVNMTYIEQRYTSLLACRLRPGRWLKRGARPGTFEAASLPLNAAWLFASSSMLEPKWRYAGELRKPCMAG